MALQTHTPKEAEIPVVAIDEEEAIAVPVENVVAVDGGGVSTMSHEASPLTPNQKPPGTTNNPTAPLPSTGTNNQNYGDGGGFDCLLCGDAKLYRLHPGNNFFISLCGNSLMDLRGSRLPPGSVVRIFVVRLCGDIQLFVPRRTRVIVRRLLLCGDRDIYLEDDDQNENLETVPPCVSLMVLCLCGGVRVRNTDGLMDEEAHTT